MKQEGRGRGSLITEGQLKLEGHLSHPPPCLEGHLSHPKSHPPQSHLSHPPPCCCCCSSIAAELHFSIFWSQQHSSRPLCCTRAPPLHFISLCPFAFHFFLQNTAFLFPSHFLLISMPRTDLKRNNTSHIFYSFLPHFLSKRYILLHKLWNNPVEMKLSEFCLCVLLNSMLFNVFNTSKILKNIFEN